MNSEYLEGPELYKSIAHSQENEENPDDYTMVSPDGTSKAHPGTWEALLSHFFKGWKIRQSDLAW